MKILIVGLGAIGSHVALALRNIDAELTLCDFDVIEHKNTQAQFHTINDVSINKAKSIESNIYNLFDPLASFASENHKITAKNAQYAIQRMGIVIDCTDNIAARTALIDACGDTTPLLHGAMSADGTFAQAVWTERFTPDSEDGDGVTCENGENLPFHMLVGSQVAILAQQFLKSGVKNSVQITPTKIYRI